MCISDINLFTFRYNRSKQAQDQHLGSIDLALKVGFLKGIIIGNNENSKAISDQYGHLLIVRLTTKWKPSSACFTIAHPVMSTLPSS